MPSEADEAGAPEKDIGAEGQGKDIPGIPGGPARPHGQRLNSGAIPGMKGGQVT